MAVTVQLARHFLDMYYSKSAPSKKAQMAKVALSVLSLVFPVTAGGCSAPTFAVQDRLLSHFPQIVVSDGGSRCSIRGYKSAVLRSTVSGAAQYLVLTCGDSSTGGTVLVESVVRNEPRVGLRPMGSTNGFDRALCAVTDFDGDGIEDLAVSESIGKDNSDCVTVLGSRGWEVIRRIDPDCAGATVGRALSGMEQLVRPSGDVLLCQVGQVKSGQSIKTLGSYAAIRLDGNGVEWRQNTGQSIAEYTEVLRVVNDANGDGVRDVLLNRANLVDELGSAVPIPAAALELRSGSDFRVIQEYACNTAKCGYLYSFEQVSDVDGDGLSDYVLAQPADEYERGTVECVSSRTGARLWTFSATAERTNLGFRVRSCGDMNRDGFDDILISGYDIFNGGCQIHCGATGSVIRRMQRLELEDEGVMGWAVHIVQSREKVLPVAFTVSLSLYGQREIGHFAERDLMTGKCIRMFLP